MIEGKERQAVCKMIRKFDSIKKTFTPKKSEGGGDLRGFEGARSM